MKPECWEFARFVCGNSGRFPAGGKGVRRPGSIEDEVTMLLGFSREM